MDIFVEYLLPASFGAWVWVAVWAAISIFIYMASIAGNEEVSAPLGNEIPTRLLLSLIAGGVFVAVVCGIIASSFEWSAPLLFTPLLVHCVIGLLITIEAWWKYH